MGHGYSCTPPSLVELCGGSTPINVLLVGLDNSGKTTLLDRLVKESSESHPSTRRGHCFTNQEPKVKVEVVTSVNNRDNDVAGQQVAKVNAKVNVTPTIGFNITQFTRCHQRFVVFDMSGQSRYRNLWSYYFRQCAAIVFVVDSADRNRLPEARNELDALLTNWKLDHRQTRVPVLIYANKSDRSEAAKCDHLLCYFRLHSIIVNRPLKISCGSAIVGTEVKKSVTWLTNEVIKCRTSREQQEKSSFISWLV